MHDKFYKYRINLLYKSRHTCLDTHVGLALLLLCHQTSAQLHA